MNQQDTFQKLVTAARDDSPPLVDVSQSVVRSVGAGRKSRDVLPWIFAAVSSATAAAIITIAVRVMIARQSVSAGLIDSIFSVTQ
ncbi:MAG: hypothetical protein HN350_16800 [Phycisphaerales bacterium]|jgi:hypothetical protein|nr:hypothetical protein [Phycisphaerales bacterium]